MFIEQHLEFSEIWNKSCDYVCKNGDKKSKHDKCSIFRPYHYTPHNSCVFERVSLMRIDSIFNSLWNDAHGAFSYMNYTHVQRILQTAHCKNSKSI